MGVNPEFALAIIPKVTSGLSMPCSAFIIYEALSDHRRGKGSAIQRALVGMCIVDISASLAWFMSTWAVPAGTAPLSRGNLASCNFQGFLMQLAVGAPLYNCSLSLYYMVVIKFNWTNEQLRRIEKWVHGFIITFTVGTSIAGLPLDMYNRMGTVCWVIGSPTECGNSSSNPSDVPCDRGDWAWLFGIVFFYGPLWVCILCTMLAMALIYCRVRRTFRRNDRYRFEANQREGSNDFDVSVGSRTTKGGPRTRSVVTSVENNSQSSNRFSMVRTGVTGEVEDLAPVDENDGEDDELRRNGKSQEGEVLECSNHNDNHELGVPGNESHLASNRLSVSSEASNGIGLKAGWRTIATRASMQTSTLHPMEEEPRRKTSAKQRRKQTQAEKARKKKESLFATQALLYSASFFITWLPSTIWSVTHWFGVGGITFDIIAASTEPLQGLWNMLIFIRSRPSSEEKLRKLFGRPLSLLLNLLPAMTDEFAKSSSPPLSDFDQVDSSMQRRYSTNVNNSRHSMEANLSETIGSEACVPSVAEMTTQCAETEPMDDSS